MYGLYVCSQEICNKFDWYSRVPQYYAAIVPDISTTNNFPATSQVCYLNS